MIHRRTVAAGLTLSLVALASLSARADVRSDQKAKIEFGGMLGRMFNMFGGKGAKEGVTTTVAVKGNRKVSLNDSTGQIIDLSEEKIYDLDMKKKTYKVTTFAELRRQMEEAEKKAQEEARKEENKPAEKSEPSKPAEKQEPQVEVDFNIKNTGEKKQLNGFDTHQAIVTITVREKGKTLEQSGGMVMTSDMWLAPQINEMKEVYDFDRKYAEKLYGPMYSGVSAQQMAAVMAMYPMMKDAIGKMNTEGGKIDGTAIMTVTTMDAVKSADQVAAEATQTQDSSQKTPTSVGGLLGGFAKRAAAKKAAGNDEGKDKSRSTFMTATTEVLKVSTSVSADELAIPAGFKETK
jgi:hypothetical protein